ncbi:M15 family metallopeptidase [Bacillus niameyensis]|uniref:M15 family metallopeptidase n=1 Tax=Bacillus niameyensis TaxID=1522308 RepID=UPI0007825B04|nr:M15 family metallopeptidase [Bacillus niameyensis]
MKRSLRWITTILFLTLLIAIQSGCNFLNQNNDGNKADEQIEDQNKDTENQQNNTIEKNNKDEENTNQEKPPADDKNSNASKDNSKPKAIEVVTDPTDIRVLVNKQFKLPDDYAPDDLVYPDVRFIFSEKVEKRQMREVAAKELEKMFAAAEKDGIYLAGASGYRSQATQIILYNNYVDKDGKEAADRYSARPGHSEHQTGLTMDVSTSSGECAVQDCFADTPEAKWLAEHAHDYGFIIRYPKGKENITGYQYEPWHIRYVGTEIAKELSEKNITLEEYFGVAVPVDGEEE